MGGDIREIYYGCIARGYRPLLRNYVTSLTTLRDAGPLENIVGKLLVNSLYGQFATTTNLGYAPAGGRPGLDLIKVPGRGSPGFGSDSFANIGLAAAITAKARIRLYRAMRAVTAHSGRILYVDTDSIVCGFPKSHKIENKAMGEVYFDTTKSDTLIRQCWFGNSYTYIIEFADGRVKSKNVTLADRGRILANARAPGLGKP